MMKQILMIVPTKDRSQMVEEVLRYEMPYYRKYNMDVYFFDSSEDEKTRYVIETINKECNCDIKYLKVGKNMCLDYKVVEILKLVQSMDYNYYWIVNDSISIANDMLYYIFSILRENYDLIRLPLSGEGDCEDYVTYDIDNWFHECSQGMAHMASTIMNKSLLVKTIDWEYLRDKYIYNNILDDQHGYFFTVGFYLEQIAQLEEFKGLFIGNKHKWRRDSPLKRNQIYWKKYVFETWAKSYPETILKLPDNYTDKENVIRKSDNIKCGRFSKEMLIHYRLNGLYDKQVYDKYKKYFKYVTTESYECCKEIAEMPLDRLKREYPNLKLIEEEWENKLQYILEQKGINNMYIYGAGLYGEKVIKKLKNLDRKIKGIVVTTTKNNVTELCGYKVHVIDGIKVEEEDFFLLCALPGVASKMKQELIKRNISKYIGLFDV